MSRIRSQANSTSGTAFGWFIVLFIAAFLTMSLIKLGMVWFG